MSNSFLPLRSIQKHFSYTFVYVIKIEMWIAEHQSESEREKEQQWVPKMEMTVILHAIISWLKLNVICERNWQLNDVHCELEIDLFKEWILKGISASSSVEFSLCLFLHTSSLNTSTSVF